MPVYISPPPRSPIAQLLAAIVGVLAMAGAFLFGLVALAVFAGLAAILGIAAWIYSWRIRKQVERHSRHARPGTGHLQGDTIEAEYTVISRQNDNN